MAICFTAASSSSQADLPSFCPERRAWVGCRQLLASRILTSPVLTRFAVSDWSARGKLVVLRQTANGEDGDKTVWQL
jgi:hypothetical protein